MQRRKKKMWDPISIFYCMWVLNIGLPEGRLSVADSVQLKEEAIINKTIVDSTTIRGGI